MAPNSVSRLRVELGDSIIDDGLSVTFDRYGNWYETYELPPRHAVRLKRALHTMQEKRRITRIIPQFGWTCTNQDSYIEVIYEF